MPGIIDNNATTTKQSIEVIESKDSPVSTNIAVKGKKIETTGNNIYRSRFDSIMKFLYFI